MDSSTCSLLLMCICFEVFGTAGSSWTSDMPHEVKGLSGSCVLIPCTFSYPDTKQKLTQITGIWLHDNDIIFHKEHFKIQQQYQSRTTLVGNTTEKNCSLKIDPLQLSDVGPFRFRVEIKDYDNFSYKERVSISVMSEPESVQFSVNEDMEENETGSASCSVSHSCPGSPPKFTWNHSGQTLYRSRQLVDGQWNITSTLTFHPTHTDNNKPLQCTVTYRGGKQQKASKILHVKYAPKNVTVECETDVKEGQCVDLTCTSNAHPPTSRYEWHNETGAQLNQGNLYVVPNVSRHLGALYCTAINEVGRVTSRAVRLNVLYAPEIKADSSCFFEDSLVKCVCTVDSNPPSVANFKLGDKILQGTTSHKNGSYTIRALREEFHSFEFVNCSANNTLGIAQLQLSLPPDDMSLIIFIATGAASAVFLVILLTVVGVFMKRRGRAAHSVASNMSAMLAEVQACSDKRKAIHDDEPCSVIYNNEPFYGNIGTDWDDQIYANV